MTDKITITVGSERHELPINGSKTPRVGSVSPSMKLTVEDRIDIAVKAEVEKIAKWLKTHGMRQTAMMLEKGEHLK